MRHVDREHEQTIFHACLELPPSERDAYLEGACGNDEELRERVEVLLEAHARAAAFTLFPAIQQTLSPDLASIGPYRLVQELGEGGMGTVYEAEQLEPVRRRVAIKLLKLGLDSKEFVARFMMERQALAAMDHPYIAKVFDAGETAAGRPYFVMELCGRHAAARVLRCSPPFHSQARRAPDSDLPGRAARSSERRLAP